MFPAAVNSPSSSILSQPSLIVVGLGNPILGDDGVGWKVAEAVRQRLGEELTPDSRFASVAVECYSLGGLSLMEHLVGYDRAIIVDAFNVDRPAGTVFKIKLDELPDYSSQHTTSAHDTSLKNAIEMGKTMGAHLPGEVTLVGIASEQLFEFSEELTPAIVAAVPEAVRLVLNLIFTGDAK